MRKTLLFLLAGLIILLPNTIYSGFHLGMVDAIKKAKVEELDEKIDTLSYYYSGITERDESASPMGEPDPDDWKDIDGVITNIRFYPNPIQFWKGHYSGCLLFGYSKIVTIEIYQNPKKRVKSFQSQLPTAEYHWNGKDDEGRKLEDGIYRMFIKTEIGETYGDIEIQR